MNKPKEIIQQEISGVNNVDKFPFASNEQTIHHQPDKIVVDFKSVYPQFVENQPIMVINHRVILLDLYNAKLFLKIFKENIDKYVYDGLSIAVAVVASFCRFLISFSVFTMASGFFISPNVFSYSECPK